MTKSDKVVLLVLIVGIGFITDMLIKAYKTRKETNKIIQGR